MPRAQQKLSANSEYAISHRKRWLYETYAALIQEHGIYIDFRVQIRALKDDRPLLRIGGVYHRWSGEYLSGTELQVAEKALGDPVVWRLTKPQIKLFSFLPRLLDKDREIPIQELLLRGGRRTSKTEGGVLLTLAMGIIYPYSKLACFTLDYKSAQEMLGKFEMLMPESWYASYDKSLNTMYLRNGTTIQFFSQKNYKKAGRSYSFDMILLDEPTYYENSQAILDGCIGSVIQYDGAIVALFTPPPVRETFYFEEQKSKSPEPELNQSVKTIYFGATFDNEALSEKAIRRTMLLAKTMSKSEYEREILGRYARSSGAAIYDYHKDVHIIPVVPDYLVDITSEYCGERWNGGESYEFIGGMDFNESPMSFCAYKIYWDPSGGTMIAHKHIFGQDVNALRFGQQYLLPWLRTMYPTIHSDSELVSKIILIVDASAWWQGDNAGKGRDSVLNTAQKQLQSLGFTCKEPKVAPRRTNSKKTNKNKYGSNPLRSDRMESFRSRLLDHNNYPHVFWLETCKEIAECVENVQLKNGKPDPKSEFAHGYDASSYPIYNMYPKLQLFSTDVGDLLKTYSIVHDIGQKCLTEEQRMAHPVCQALGKDLVT